MDANQFAQLLTAFNQYQQNLVTQISQKIQQQQNEPTNLNPILSNIPPFKNFDQAKEKIKCYLERFENYLAMKNITEDQKKAQLLCLSIGSMYYNNLSAILGKPIKNLTYSQLKKSLQEMLLSHRSVVVLHHYFLSIRKKTRLFLNS